VGTGHDGKTRCTSVAAVGASVAAVAASVAASGTTTAPALEGMCDRE